MTLEFEVSTLNFGGDTTGPQDLVDLTMAGIADAGYVVRHSHNRFYPGRFHLFFDRLQPEVFAYLRQNAIPYGLVVTEEITPDGAFGWSQIEHGGDPIGMGDIYAPQVAGATFVWCLLEASLAFCRRHNARVGLVRYGFSPRMLPRFGVAWDRRDIAAIMTGPMTERRTAILGALRGRGLDAQHGGHPLPGWWRDNLVARARMHVAPHRTDDHVRFVNPQRVVQSVLYKVALAIELHDPQRHELAVYCEHFAPCEFVDGVLRLQAVPDALRRRAEANFERLADERPMSRTFRELIESTLAA